MTAAFKEAPRPKLITSSADFSNFVPPDYLFDLLMQRGYIYSITAATGSGKTAIALLFAACAATGRGVGSMDVEQVRVLYLAGENSMDVKIRWIALCGSLGVDPKDMPVDFVDGHTNLFTKEMLLNLRAEIGTTEYGFVIVDTSAAYYSGEDENSNKQLLDHAKALRLLTKLPGRPSVLVCCHPTKNAASDNLLPRGGGAFVAEMDGNLTLVKDGENIVMHWQGKYRGPNWDPKHFRLVEATDARLRDTKKRLIKTVLAEAVSEEAVAASRKDDNHDVVHMLMSFHSNPGLSVRAR